MKRKRERETAMECESLSEFGNSHHPAQGEREASFVQLTGE